MPQTIADIDRFWTFVAKDPSGCWLWVGGSGAYSRNGYGRFNRLGARISAHRFAYEQFVGPIPEGLEIDHLCRVRACVNPDHLEAVTRAENRRRCPDDAASLNARKTHCVHGHEFTPENTRIDRLGTRWPQRSCRTCHRNRATEARKRRESAA